MLRKLAQVHLLWGGCPVGADLTPIVRLEGGRIPVLHIVFIFQPRQQRVCHALTDTPHTVVVADPLPGVTEERSVRTFMLCAI